MGKDSFTELFWQFQPPLYLYLYRMCGSKETAEELLQETFYRAMLSLRARDMKYARAWLYKVARHLCIDWLRKRSGEAAMIQAVACQSTGVSSFRTPEEALSIGEERRTISEAMAMMPEHYRSILYLREIEGFSYEELGETLDIPLGRVKVNLHRSREKFRQLLARTEERMNDDE
ncbi:RNA polymerase sigma factor [Paenibacillus nasutitermitis]|uniref:RNA polymerase sigma-70 factor, ECF subfamily n=1 Tax=Paenibacillus nasutitermitis TaxID=1652958 RepID=A0A916ZF98_9BACL|nr:RNA polymerase sigma factor [Paenibacillus nasutitermitis]GGD93637.1 hypothetical protein GCM10010911_60350 [Paenibacillus nasutitermitis]